MYGHIVLASTKSGIIPNGIKLFTGSPFSHSLVTIPDILNVPMCIEACEGGVDTCRFDTNYISNPEQAFEVWRINLPQEIKDAAIVTLLNDLEISYGYLQYPFLVYRKLNLVVGRDIKSRDNWFHRE